MYNDYFIISTNNILTIKRSVSSNEAAAWYDKT